MGMGAEGADEDIILRMKVTKKVSGVKVYICCGL
jgi:hypothetical protein